MLAETHQVGPYNRGAFLYFCILAVLVPPLVICDRVVMEGELVPTEEPPLLQHVEPCEGILVMGAVPLDGRVLNAGLHAWQGGID